MEIIKVKTGYRSIFVVDNVGKSGGLALMWSDETRVEIQNYSHCHISAVVQLETNERLWYLTGFYGHLEVGKRHEAWSLLHHIRSLSPEAWLYVGDFNEIMEESEKFGGVRKSQGIMDEFYDTLRDYRLHDLGYVGARFTWSNMRHENNFVKERLDRATATNEWRDLYPRQVVEVLANRSSDHTPLLINFNKRHGHRRPWRRKFHFKAKWNGKEKPKAIISSIWREVNLGANAWSRVGQKLTKSKLALSEWAQKESRLVEELIKNKTVAIENL
jgi:hypothetical protein